MLSEWITIIGLAIQLFHKTDCSENTTVILRWENPDKMGFHTVADKNALFISLETKTDNKPLITYIFIPWQDIYEKNNTGDLQPMALVYDFVTVNEFAVIYKENFAVVNDNEYQSDIAKFEQFIKNLINYSSNQHVIKEENGITSPEGVQIISLKEYPYYSIQEVALPGSKAVQPNIKEPLPKGKMLRHVLVPDAGTVKSSWLINGNSITDSCFIKNEKRLTEIFIKGLEKSLKQPSEKNDIYILCRDEINAVTDECYADVEVVSLLQEFLKRSMNKTDIMSFDAPFEMFPDYQAKTSPDIATDFMYEVSKEFEKIPAAGIKNTKELVKLFKTYSKLVRKNPGKWEDGNMILGARPKEYIPSKEELIADEIGERIRKTAEECKPMTLAEKSKTRVPKQLKYCHYTFTHSDVMGSGRFYYVDQIHETVITLK